MRAGHSFTIVTATILYAQAAAHAGTVIVQNTTDVVSYNSGSGGGATGYFNGSDIGSSIGSNFSTSQLAVTTSALANGTYAVDLQYTTLFSGSETLGSSNIYYPDIFLRTPESGYSTAPFDYAISLGTETANGGLAAGFYSVSSYLTSQQVWSGRPGYVYGGQYTGSSAYQPGQAGYAGYNAPVVLTAGNLLSGASVTDGQSGSAYTVGVKLTLTAAEAAGFVDGADIFWGTGDCANGGFLASLPSGTGSPTVGPIPEPAPLALMVVGLGSLLFVRRRTQA